MDKSLIKLALETLREQCSDAGDITNVTRINEEMQKL